MKTLMLSEELRKQGDNMRKVREENLISIDSKEKSNSTQDRAIFTLKIIDFINLNSILKTIKREWRKISNSKSKEKTTNLTKWEKWEIKSEKMPKTLEMKTKIWITKSNKKTSAMKRKRKNFTDKTKTFNNNWRQEEKKIESCLRHFKTTTTIKSKMKKPGLLRLNPKPNKSSKWEREKASEVEFQWVFICNNNKQKDFTKSKLLFPELEWTLQTIWKERAHLKLGCELKNLSKFKTIKIL